MEEVEEEVVGEISTEDDGPPPLEGGATSAMEEID